MERRPDPLKVFLGSLDPDINKPKLLTLFHNCGLTVAEVYVPMFREGNLAIAFVCFETPEQAGIAVEMLNGCKWEGISMNMKAHIGDTSWKSFPAVIAKLFLAFV
jgi:RNA recognition motif-containing protein